MAPSTTTRRRLLGVLAGVCAAGAGCAGGPADTDASTSRVPTTAPGTTAATTTVEPADESTFPPDVDERVDTRPPGSPALGPSGAWPMPRFDAGNTAVNRDGTGLRDAEPYWRLDAGGPATVHDGTLFNVHSRSRDTAALTYRDPSTAAVTATRSLVQYAINAPPVVDDGRVFVSTFIEVFCFDAVSGEEVWRGPEMDGIQAPPAVHDGTVFVSSGGFDSTSAQCRAFDAATGRERWRYDTGAEAKGIPAVADDHDQLFVVSEAGLHALDAATGSESYVLREHFSAWETPVVRDGTVYVSTGGDAPELLAVAATDGSARWRTPVDMHDPPVVADEHVYARTGDGLVALDVADGSVATEFGRRATPLARLGDVLYTKRRGGVRAYDATTSESLWSFRTEEVQVSDTIGRHVYHVTPVDGAVYVSARDAFYGVGPR